MRERVTMGCAGLAALALAACQPGTPPPGGTSDGRAPDGNASFPDGPAPPIDAPAIDAGPLPPQTSRLRIVNRCADPIWIAHSNNLAGEQNVALSDGEYHDYAIPAGGLPSVRFWPKIGCGGDGHGCRIGDTGEGGGAPCGAQGCQPPIDSKFEITFAATGTGDISFYNLSLVDGYTLPFSVTPVGATSASCTASDCSGLSLDACPAHEDLVGADLRVSDAGGVIGCLSPCKAWQYPPPYGLGHPESQDPGLHMCCPTPIDPGTGQCTPANGCMTADACRDASDPESVVHTTYVAAVHAGCPTAYAYSYDDGNGLHACPSDTGFAVVFCP